MEDKRQAEALFRYLLIRELADPGLSPRRRGVMTRALAEIEHVRHDGSQVQSRRGLCAAGCATGARVAFRRCCRG